MHSLFMTDLRGIYYAEMALHEFCILKQQICKFISIGGHWCWGAIGLD